MAFRTRIDEEGATRFGSNRPGIYGQLAVQAGVGLTSFLLLDGADGNTYAIYVDSAGKLRKALAGDSVNIKALTVADGVVVGTET